MNYVIIGNSIAGIGCIEGIRAKDPTGSIALVGEEPYPVYSRPLISYLLLGRVDEEHMHYRPKTFYQDNDVKTYFGRRAESVDAAKKAVVLDDGTCLPYDKLLLAAGSRPFVPPMAGLDSVKNKFTFMNLDSAKALEKALTPQSRVLIIGAGLIGLKCAEGIAARVAEINVVDMADRVLPSILDETGSAVMQKHLEKHKMHFFLSDSVARFADGMATLKSGKTLAYDIVVVAVGVRPNTQLAEQAGCKVERGICTNVSCETTVPDIYAAGDCAKSHDITSGTDRVLALLPNAHMQGMAAGTNMAGGSEYYDKAIPMNSIGFFGLHIITAGSYDGEVYLSQKDGAYKKLFTKDNRLTGMILIGDIRRAGIYTSLIREQTPLDSVDFDLIKEKPQLMAFSKKDRKIKLAGAKQEGDA